MSKLLQTAKNLLHHDKARPEATAVEKARPALPSVPSGSSEMAIPALGHTTGYAHEMVVQDEESRSSSTAESGVTPRVFTSPSAQTSPASTTSTLSPGSIGNTVLEHRAK